MYEGVRPEGSAEWSRTNELAPLGLTLALTLISVSLRTIHGCSGEAEDHDVG